MDDFNKIIQRLDTRMAHVEEQIEAVVQEMRTTADETREDLRKTADRMAGEMHQTAARVDGMSREFRGMRTDLAEFSGAVKGFGTAYEQQMADVIRRLEALEKRKGP